MEKSDQHGHFMKCRARKSRLTYAYIYDENEILFQNAKTRKTPISNIKTSSNLTIKEELLNLKASTNYIKRALHPSIL